MSLHLCRGSELCQIRKHFTVMASTQRHARRPRPKTIIVRSRRFLDKKKESTTVVHQGKNKETVGESSFIVKNAYRGYLYCPFYNELSTCASNEWCLYYAHSTERAEKNLIKIDKLNKYSDSRIEYGSKPQWGEIRKNIPISLLPAPPIHSPEH